MKDIIQPILDNLGVELITNGVYLLVIFFLIFLFLLLYFGLVFFLHKANVNSNIILTISKLFAYLTSKTMKRVTKDDKLSEIGMDLYKDVEESIEKKDNKEETTRIKLNIPDSVISDRKDVQ